MKSDKNILIAFLLNILFSMFEIFGGLITGSISIVSDAIHDFGDAISIGISYFLERISKKNPDQNYTYGYLRYSVLGAFITTIILMIGSSFVIYEAIKRLFNPVDINYNGMIVFAIIGVIVNLLAAYVTKEGDSINQKAVNLHMLEDVLGWVVVLIGSIVIKFTDIKMIDPVMSILVSIFIFINVIKNFKSILDLFLEKIPNNISLDEIKKHILEINNVVDVHHIHIWSIDGNHNYATMHVVVDKNEIKVKNEIRKDLCHHGISHVTIEIENKNEPCNDLECHIEYEKIKHHHHH